MPSDSIWLPSDTFQPVYVWNSERRGRAGVDTALLLGWALLLLAAGAVRCTARLGSRLAVLLTAVCHPLLCDLSCS